MAERRARGNILEIPAEPLAAELVELVADGEGVTIERIVSTGQATPAGEWLEQARGEWVVLLEGDAELVFENGSRLRMRSGDHALIPAGERHRVEWTRDHPPCVWLAVHATGLTTADTAP